MNKIFTAILVLTISTFPGCNSNMNKMKNSEHKHTNRLIDESSPYLLQHVHNPVDWLPWNEKTLLKAKNLDKPLLISIGYSACHWCHVMEHESFEDEEVASIMNEHFICIKVDREERPDVDDVYMSAIQQISGRGGWPLNCFALPNGQPFHGGTYFPKENWKRVLLQVVYEYKENRAQLETFSEKLQKGMEQDALPLHAEILDKKESRNRLDNTVAKWSQAMDNMEGGANKAPKFPLPNNYEFLLDYSLLTDNDSLMDHVLLTLSKMARGGIYDQLGGGFARHSVDAIWKVPHFEKMLYDNAQLLSLYAKAYRLTQNDEFKEVIEQTQQFLFREMKDQSGAFYSALDADSEGEEGKFYIWKADELKEIIKEEYAWFKEYYQVNEKGYWEHDHYILMRNEDASTFAKSKGWSLADFNVKLNKARSLLMAKRDNRIRPGLDDKCLTSWNGLAIIGLCDSYKALGDARCLKSAEEIGNWLWQNQHIGYGELLHSYKNGKSSIHGFLEDYAFATEGFIALYEVTMNDEWMEKASLLMTFAIKHFSVTDDVLFASTSIEQKDILLRKVNYYDNVIPSANSQMCWNLKKIGLFYGQSDWLERSTKMLARVKPFVHSYGSGFSNWLISLNLEVFGSKELVVVGEDASRKLADWWQSYTPNIWTIGSSSISRKPLFKDRYAAGQTFLYMCSDGSCQLPVKNVQELR